MADPATQTFRSASGIVTGALSLICLLAFAGFGILSRDAGIADWLIVASLLLAVVVWAAMLRPAVHLGATQLVLRNVLETVRIPLAAVDGVAVRQVLAVDVGERVFDSPALGRTRQQLARDDARGAQAHLSDSLGLFIEARIRQRAADERARLGIEQYSEEQAALAAQVRRVRAWPEIAVLALLVVAFVVAVVV